VCQAPSAESQPLHRDGETSAWPNEKKMFEPSVGGMNGQWLGRLAQATIYNGYLSFKAWMMSASPPKYLNLHAFLGCAKVLIDRP
jgi:hypothetical protein